MTRLNQTVVFRAIICAIAVCDGLRANSRRQTGLPSFTTAGSVRAKKTLRLMSCSLFLLCGMSFGQVQTIPTTSAYESHGDYSINLQNLSIVLNSDIRQKSGLMAFSATSSSVANQFASGVSHSDGKLYLGTGGFGFPVHVYLVGASVGYSRSSAVCGSTGLTNSYYYGWVINTNDGNTHATTPVAGSSSGVGVCVADTATVTTTDGSGLTAVITISPAEQITVYDANGNHVVSTATWSGGGGGGSVLFNTLYDSNGNSMSQSSNVNPVYTDSLGLTALTSTYVSTTSSNISWTDVNGNTQQIALTDTPLYPSTAFGCPSPNLDWTGTAQLSLLTKAAYPNGTSLGIGYEQTPNKTSAYTTGRIASLSLRTGGSVSFSYSGFDCTYLEPTTMKRTTSDGTWTYTWAHVTQGNTTTVVDPAGNTVVYTFSPLPILLSKTVKQGASTVLYSESYCYNADSTCAAAPSFPITQIDTYTTLGGMTTSSHVKKTFDSLGNLLSSSSYDFGATTPTFTTTITYGSWNLAGGYCQAIGNYITDKPCHIYTSDAAGNGIAQTAITYDSKGNALNTYVWTGPTGTQWLSSSATYNSNGTVATSTDVSGVQTTYTYGDCGGAFPTQVTVGSLNTYVSWNCDGGVKTSSTDASGNVTNYKYVNAAGTADPLWRLSQVIDPLSNVRYTIYGTNTVEKKMSFGSSVEDSIITTDGYGRPIRQQTEHGSSYDTVTTKYNVVANTVSTSVPCSEPLGSDCTSGFTVTTLDGAGRTTSTVDGGGLTLASAFQSQDVISTLSPHPANENNKVVQTQLDGLGRVMSTCSILSSGGSACGQVTGGSGVATAFGYSTTTGSSTTTATRGVQTRTTVKDALGRVTSQTDPERGTTQYVYDTFSAPSTTGCNTNPVNIPGRLWLVTFPSVNEKCYAYNDPLGRVTDTAENLSDGSNLICTHFRFDTSANGLFTAPGAISNAGGRLVEAETDNCAVYPPTAATTISDEWFSYDAMGNMADMWEKTPHSNGYYHSSATYFANGKMSSLTLPSVGTVHYTVDADGRWQSMKVGTLTLVSSVAYGPTGPTQVNIGMGTDKDVYTYDAATGRMKTFQFFVGSANSLNTLNWNTNGSLGSLNIVDGFYSSNSQTCAFIYDDLKRLTSDQCGTPWAQTYSYDIYDNMNEFGSQPFTYTYNAANNHYSTASVTYDADGNLTYDGVNTYTYNASGKLWSAYPAGKSCTTDSTGGCFTYDAFGRVVERQTSSGYTQTLYSPAGKSGGMAGQGMNYSFIPSPGGSFVQTSGAQTFEYNHRDWLGTTRTFSLIPSSGNGTIISDRAFSPYGKIYDSNGTNGTQSQIFTGDTHLSIGLFDTPNRELNQSQGRWLTPDPARSGWNLYAYPTDPNTQTDPSGLAMLNIGREAGTPFSGDAAYSLQILDWQPADSSVPSDYSSSRSTQGGGYRTVENPGVIILLDPALDPLPELTVRDGAMSFSDGALNTTAVSDSSGMTQLFPHPIGQCPICKTEDGWMDDLPISEDAVTPFGGIGRLLDGYSSFRAFKVAEGAAEEGMQWHHIVEQTPGNIKRFGQVMIQSVENLVQVPKDLHIGKDSISAYYSSKDFFTGEMTVRGWLATQSFEAQRDFGLNILRGFGIIP